MLWAVPGSRKGCVGLPKVARSSQRGRSGGGWKLGTRGVREPGQVAPAEAYGGAGTRGGGPVKMGVRDIWFP